MAQSTPAQNAQRLPAEQVFGEELNRLKDWDDRPKPPGWALSPVSIEHFILGYEPLNIERKVVVDRALITRLVTSVASNRGVMLVGTPGTAKSWLSELLSAAICGSSTLVVQGGAITDIQQVLYRWNEQLVVELGWCREALLPGPLVRAMQAGQLLRFEEMARCSPEVQDALLSLISERCLVVPELPGPEGIIYAAQGFNLIATSNSLDAGINNLSAALKRRLNFETLYPIAHIDDEVAVVLRESKILLQNSGVPIDLQPELVMMLVTIFHELRTGCTVNGTTTDRLVSTVMSTAEAISVAHAMGVSAYYYSEGNMDSDDLVYFLLGAAVKDNQHDLRRLKHYFDSNIANKEGEHWQKVYQSAIKILKQG